MKVTDASEDWKCAVIAFLALLFFKSAPLSAGYKGSLTVDEIHNSSACLPAIADDGDHIVRFENGLYSGPGIPFAQMREVVFGQIRGEQEAVAEIVWNTGGSGNWEIVARFAREKGKVVCRGVYSPGGELPDGGTVVERIELRSDHIYLYGADPVHRRSIKEPLMVPAESFKPCGAARGDKTTR